MPRYVWKDGHFRDPRTGEPMPLPERDTICMPRVISDLPDYVSPVTGQVVSGRAARREDLKRNDCVELDPPKRPRGYKNPSFAHKRGLRTNDEL
jgi:hypothetical protein